MRTPIDENGYYHLGIDRERQTLQGVSGYVGDEFEVPYKD